MNTSGSVGMILSENANHPEIKQFESLSRPCPDCGGEGDWKKSIQKVVTVEYFEDCPHCNNGYIKVKCNNCVEGWSSRGPCRTCAATGYFTYYPTKRFPLGKPCRWCKGTGKLQKFRNEVYTTPVIKCKRCKGTGEIFITLSKTPEKNEDDATLIKMVDKMVNIMIPNVD